jgi:hypothetical protein
VNKIFYFVNSLAFCPFMMEKVLQASLLVAMGHA